MTEITRDYIDWRQREYRSRYERAESNRPAQRASQAGALLDWCLDSALLGYPIEEAAALLSGFGDRPDQTSAHRWLSECAMLTAVAELIGADPARYRQRAFEIADGLPDDARRKAGVCASMTGLALASGDAELLARWRARLIASKIDDDDEWRWVAGLAYRTTEAASLDDDAVAATDAIRLLYESTDSIFTGEFHGATTLATIIALRRRGERLADAAKARLDELEKAARALPGDASCPLVLDAPVFYVGDTLRMFLQIDGAGTVSLGACPIDMFSDQLHNVLRKLTVRLGRSRARAGKEKASAFRGIVEGGGRLEAHLVISEDIDVPTGHDEAYARRLAVGAELACAQQTSYDFTTHFVVVDERQVRSLRKGFKKL